MRTLTAESDRATATEPLDVRVPFRTPWSRHAITPELRVALFEAARTTRDELGQAKQADISHLWQRRNALAGLCISIVHRYISASDFPSPRNQRVGGAIARLADAIARATFITPREAVNEYPDIRDAIAGTAAALRADNPAPGWSDDRVYQPPPADSIYVQRDAIPLEVSQPPVMLGNVSVEAGPGTTIINQGNGSIMIMATEPPAEPIRGRADHMIYLDDGQGESYSAYAVDPATDTLEAYSFDGETGQITREMMAEAAVLLPRVETERMNRNNDVLPQQHESLGGVFSDMARRIREAEVTDPDGRRHRVPVSFDRITLPKISNEPLSDEQLQKTIDRQLEYFLDVAMPWPRGPHNFRFRTVSDVRDYYGDPPRDPLGIRGVMANVALLDEISNHTPEQAAAIARDLSDFTREIIRQPSPLMAAIAEQPSELSINVIQIEVFPQYREPNGIGLSFGRDFLLLGDDQETRYWIMGVQWFSGGERSATGEIHVSRNLPEHLRFSARRVQEVGRYRDSGEWRPIFRANR